MSKPFPLIERIETVRGPWQGLLNVTLQRTRNEDTGKEYELAHGFNTPDRSAYIAVRYAPGK